MRRHLSLGKYLVMPLILLFISLLSVFLGSTLAKASTTSQSPDLNINVGSAVSLVLRNCDGSNSSVLKLAIDPTPTGTFKSACQTTSVGTNTPGYSLTVRATGTNANHNSGAVTNSLLYLNPNSLTTLPSIPATTNTITSPSTLTSNTWGFAVEGIDNFDTTYTANDENNNYAQLPTTDTTVYNTSEWPIVNTDHTFYYATKVDTNTTAGTYGTTITYTAIGEEPAPVPCTTSDVVICIKVTEPGTIAIQNLWASPITYTINGSDKTTIASSELSTDLSVSVGDVFEVEEGIDNTTFRSWIAGTRGFITNTTDTGTAKVSITKMPEMNKFTTDDTGTTAGDSFFRLFAGSAGISYPATIYSLPYGSFDTSNITSVGDSFFRAFNFYGSLTYLPDGSFNTGNITSVSTYFFYSFNNSGTLTSLPAGSFNTSNITSVADYFFAYFNSYGSLTFLPVGSFDTGNITSVGDFYFYRFNESGSLTSLPAGSFDISNITSTVGNDFFSYFNSSGSLTSLPAGSFDISNITSTGYYFFYRFNYSGSLTSLPIGSFNTGSITSVGNNFFSFFNSYGALTSLPVGSFDISNITSVEDNFFYTFNYFGSLVSLPDGSFDTSGITSTIGNDFFSYFNSSGSLTSLPDGSFDISNITLVEGYYFFALFNYSGALTSLPDGSFDISNITSVGDRFFSSFNYSGSLTSLPAGSFNTNNMTSVGYNFFAGFNQSGALTSLPAGSFNTNNITSAENYFFSNFNGGTVENAGKLQAGSGVTITNKSSVVVYFWQRPNGNPDGVAFNTNISPGGAITFLGI